jgi:chromosome partitioning protein
MYNHIVWVKENLNKRLSIEGVLLTMFEPNTKAWGLTKQALFENFSNDILQTVIPKSITITEAEFYGKPTMLFDIKSSGSVAYLNLANELMNKSLPLQE